MTEDRFPFPAERIERSILLLRGEKLMLSPDLTKRYGVAPRVLVRAVERNLQRFPTDSMFQLSREEYPNLRLHIVTRSWGGAQRSRAVGDVVAGDTFERSEHRRRRSPRDHPAGFASLRTRSSWFSISQFFLSRFPVQMRIIG